MTDHRTYLFGSWPEEPQPKSDDAFRWLAGDDSAMTPEVAADIRAELVGQQRYREAVRAELAKLATDLFGKAGERVYDVSTPIASMLEAWRTGYDQGAYRGYAEAGEMVAVALDKAMKRARGE